jgi:hypothetical protein
MESVAAERLNKLGKNPSIISTRHDLKRDAAVLKDIIDRATPQPSSEESEQSDSESSLNKKHHFKSSLAHLHDEFKKSFNQNRLSQDTRKYSTEDKKIKNLTKIFLTAPNSNQNQIIKSPSTPLGLFGTK